MRAKYWNLQTSFNVHIAAAHRYIYIYSGIRILLSSFSIKGLTEMTMDFKNCSQKRHEDLRKHTLTAHYVPKCLRGFRKHGQQLLKNVIIVKEREKKESWRRTLEPLSTEIDFFCYFSPHIIPLCVFWVSGILKILKRKKRMLKIWYERLKIWLVTELMKRKLVKKTLDRERGNRVKYTKGWIIWVSLKLVNNRMKVNERRSLVLLLFCQ